MPVYKENLLRAKFVYRSGFGLGSCQDSREKWRGIGGGDNSICFPHAKNVPIPSHKMDKKRLKANRLESFCVLGQFSREKQQSMVRGK